MAEDVKVTNWPEDSAKERVAYDLMRNVMAAEGKYEGAKADSGNKPDRKYLLDLYRECLVATKGHRQ